MRLVWIFVFSGLLCACSDAGKLPPESIARSTVMGLNLGFNMHSPDEMARNVTDDVEWFTVAGAAISVEANGKQALLEGMRDYFESVRDVRAEIEATLPNLPFVATRERVYWQTDDGERSQASLAVYELEGGKVRRVWYFPETDRR